MPETRDIFVGRRDELAQLEAALRDACAGKGSLALLSGEPGIGKTRTAVELALRAESEGAQVLWGRCHEEAGAPPYWPWSQVLRDLIAALDDEMLAEGLGAEAPDIAELIPDLRARLPDLGPPTPTQDPAEARFRLFAALARLLVAAARRRPRVVVLDDLHWADAPSLRFLRFVTPDLGGTRLLFLGTYRENELSRRHPLSDALGDLTRARNTLRLRLGGLGMEETGDLVSMAAGTAPAPWLIHAIHAQTEGNPLFLREIVRYLRERGLLVAATEAPRRGLPETLRIPEGVREVIGQRLNLLSPRCNEVLRIASVIGRQFPLDVLLRAAGAADRDEVVSAIEDALDARLVEELRPGHHQFTHTLVRMTLYDELRVGERRRLHQAVGEAIEALRQDDLDAASPDLARHFHLASSAGEADRAIDYAIRAGERADAVLAFEDAVSFFQIALDLMQQRDHSDPRRLGALLLRLGEVQIKASDLDQARDTLRRAAELARRHGLPDLLADAAVAAELASFRKGYVGQRDEGLLKEALAALPEGDEVLRVKLLGALARKQLYMGSVAEAKATALEAAAWARALGDAVVAVRNMLVLIEMPAEPDETLRNLADGIELAEMAERAGELEVAAQAHLHCANHFLELARMEDCASAIAQMRRLGHATRQPYFLLWETGMRAALALNRAELTEAEALIREAIRLGALSKSDAVDPLSLVIFELRRTQGRLADVAPVLAQIAARDAAAIWRPGLALLRVELGELDAARRLFEDLAAEDFATIPRDGRWPTCLAFLTETCVALGDAGRAAVLYRLLLPRAGRNLVIGHGSGCPGAADRFLGLLATTMARWSDAERHFADAMALNVRTGARMPLAQTQHDLARMLLARGFPGDRARATDLLRQALGTAAERGLIALQRSAEALIAGIDATQAAPDALTARELEVLQLIAIGRTNADIALVLAIGVTTVATHVRSILAKTACANRTEAAAYAARHGILERG